MIRKLVFTTLSTLLFVSSFAQDGPTATDKVTNPSNSGTSGSNGSPGSQLYNVDLYSGTAGIHIPIYDYSIAGLNLGVSLNYDTHGIKVDEVASSAGIGWSLSAGGQITRQVNGMEDEVVYANRSATGAWMYNGGSTNYNIQVDKEYDDFTATFGGRSIKFQMAFVDNWLQSVVTSPENVKVFMYVSDYGEDSPMNPFSVYYTNIDSIYGTRNLCFWLTDEHNNQFFFRAGNAAKRSYIVNDTTRDYCQIQNWNLTKVITCKNDTIKFSYNYWPITYPEYKNEQINFKPVDITYNTGVDPKGVYVAKNEEVAYDGAYSQLAAVTYPNGVKLSVNSDAFRIDLWPAREMNKIMIEQKLDNNITNKLTYQLNFSYLKARYGTASSGEMIPSVGSTPEDYVDETGWNVDYNTGKTVVKKVYRLKLLSIDRIGNDGVTKEPYYSFSYDTTALPARLSGSRDFYGYHNGRTSVFNGIGNFVYRTDLKGLTMNKQTLYVSGIGTVTFGTDQTPDFSKTKSAILNKITNAGGGSIRFTYKDHVLRNDPYQYIGSYKVNSLGYHYPPPAYPADLEGENANDGLCIDSVIMTDGVNADNNVIEKYEYSDGQRFYRGGYSWYAYIFDGSARTYLSNYVTPMHFVNNSNHGYSFVEVKKYGYNGQFIGSQKYHYTNLIRYDDSIQSNLELMLRPVNFNYTNNAFPAMIFYDYRMGLVLDKSDFDQNHNVSASTQYTYYDSTENYFKNNGLYAARYHSAMSWRYGINTGRFYWSFVNMPFLLVSKTDTAYLNSGKFFKTTNYEYTPDFKLAKEKWMDADGMDNTLVYKYESIHNTSIDQYFTIPVGQTHFKNFNGVEKYLSANKTDYAAMGGYCYRPIKNLQTLIAAPVASSQYPFGLKTVNEITGYDSHNNITEVKYEDKELYACNFWDTRLGKKVASVRNAKHDEVAYTSFEGTTFSPAGTPDENRGNWSFNPSGIVYNPAVTTAGAVTGKYQYQLGYGTSLTSEIQTKTDKQYTLTFWATSLPTVSNGSLGIFPVQQAQVGGWKLYTALVNGSGMPVSISSYNNISIDEVRLYPADASITTTTYEPLFGPSSTSDERNNINYIEYDAMGRQKVTRDINRQVTSVTSTIVGSNSSN